MMLLNCGVGEDSWESLGLKGDQTSQSQRKSVLNIHWKDWCWSSNTLATWCEETTQWKWPWCWERLKARGERDDRGRECWMASPTQWTWVWANSGRWWWTEKLGMLQSMELQRDWMWLSDWTTTMHIEFCTILGVRYPPGVLEYIPPWIREHCCMLFGEGHGIPLQYSSLENPNTEEPGRLQSMGL